MKVRRRGSLGRDNAAAIIFDHRKRATGKIAEAVRQICVVAGDQCVFAEISVLAEDYLAEEVVAQSIIAQGSYDWLGVGHVAFGLAHFFLFEEEPAVGLDSSRHVVG